MKISELTTDRSWYELVKDSYDLWDGTSRYFIAVSELGWEQCLLQMSFESYGMGPINSVLGYSVVKVTDIANDEIEMRSS